MPEQVIAIRYTKPPTLTEDTTLDSLVQTAPRLKQFLSDLEGVQDLISNQVALQDTKFPEPHSHVKEFTIGSSPSNRLNIGDGQTISVQVVPGYQDGDRINLFDYNGKPFSLNAAMLFRPDPLSVDISQIVVREMKDGSSVSPPTLGQYMKNESVNLQGLGNVDVYCAIVFVPISNSADENGQYVTQLRVSASSYSGQWYKPILQGKAYGGPIIKIPHQDKPIDMIQDDGGKYWKVTPIDSFGEIAPQIFGTDTGRLVVVSLPQVTERLRLVGPRPGYGDDLFGGMKGGGTLGYGDLTATYISQGADTGRTYQSGDVEINHAGRIKALSLLTIGVRPKEFSLEKVLPALATSGK